MKTFEVGDPGGYAGMFVLKNDRSVSEMKEALKDFNTESSAARCEIHDEASSFSQALPKWLSGVPEGEAFMCIYAHMGPPGMAPDHEAKGGSVSWSQFKGLLSKKVARLWLVGCSSAELMKAFPDAKDLPVTTLLVVTEAKKPFAPLAKKFFHQFNLGKLVINCELRDLIHAEEPELGAVTKFYWLESGSYQQICEAGQARP
jgi:hypothetical protein